MRRRGYTLIEILICVSIIIVLLGIFAPVALKALVHVHKTFHTDKHHGNYDDD